MADAVDMLNLLQAPHSMHGVVGWRNGLPLTRTEFLAQTHKWRTLLFRHPGMRFALYFDDSIEFAAALFGAWHAGKTVYLPSDALPATCTALRTAVDAYLGEFPPHCAPLQVRAADCGGTEAFAPLRADFGGLVVYTSGSTGAPQAIPKKLSQLATEVATIERLFGNQSGAAEVVATVSHQHIYGLLFKVLWPLSTARPIHALSLIYPEELAQTTAARDCVLISSPAHLKRLPDSPAWMKAPHRIRAVFSSGGPLPLEIALATSTLLGRPPIEVFGSSETGGIAWRQRHADANEAWSVMPGVETRIGASDGVLEIRSPHLPVDGWFRTSDRAHASSDGRLTLAGRVDRLVKIEEKRISLDLIEARLMQSSLVREARVLVIEGRRQCVAAFIVLSDAGRAVLSESGKHALSLRLREQLADAVERVALPRRWRYLDGYPVNPQGKTTRAELLALLDGLPAAPRPIMPRMQVLEKDPQRVLLELVAPRVLAYFEGHFPAAPILPGVVQVEWAMLLARAHFALPPLFRGMRALKFQRVIRPEATISLELLQDAARASVAFKYFSPAGAHASGRLMFGTPDV